MQTVLDVIREVFGEELSPELIDRVGSVDPRKLEDFHDHYESYLRSASIPMKSQSELKPYVPVPLLTPTERHGLDLQVADFTQLDNLENVVDAIQLHLLYCHSLAVTNPLPYITDYFTLGRESIESHRELFTNFLILLNYVKPLVITGNLLLVEEPVGLQITMQRQNSSMAAASAIADEVYRETKHTRTLPREVRVSAVYQVVKALYLQFEAIHRNRAGLDLYVPDSYWQTTLVQLLEWARSNVTEEAEFATTAGIVNRRRDSTLLRNLLALQIPDFSAFDITDLVRIRQGEEFSQWRSQLGKALERVHALTMEDMSDNREALELIREELLQSRVDLSKNVGRSKFLSDAGAGFRKFAIGGVVASAMAPFTNPLTSLSVGAGNTLLGLIWDYITSRQSSEESALLNHYLLFAPKEKT